MNHFKTLDYACLAALLPLTTLYVVGEYLFNDAMGALLIPGYQHIIELMDMVMIFYLAARFQVFYKIPPLACLMQIWLAWVVLSSMSAVAEVTLRVYLQEILTRILIWPLFFLFFYYLIKSNPSLLKYIVWYFMGMGVLCAVLLMYVYNYHHNTSRVGSKQVLLEVYFPVLLLPWIFLARKRIWHILGISIMLVLVFASMKRGPLIAVGGATIAYYGVRLLVYPRAWKSNLLLPLVLALGALTIFATMDTSRGGYFASRLASLGEDEGSGRIEVYQETIKMISKSTISKIIFGHGNNSVVEDSVLGLSAHNDWLETTYDFGFVGLLIYIGIHILMIGRLWYVVRARFSLAPAFAAGYIMFFIVSSISHLVIYPWYFIFLTSFFGAVTGLTEIPMPTVRMQPVRRPVLQTLRA